MALDAYILRRVFFFKGTCRVQLADFLKCNLANLSFNSWILLWIINIFLRQNQLSSVNSSLLGDTLAALRKDLPDSLLKRLN